MLKKLLATAVFSGAVAFAIFWYLTIPAQLSPDQSAGLVEGDPVAGERVFWIGGCGSCHAEKGAKGEDKKLLGGGHRLDTPAGIFVTPNISPDPDNGIGNWTVSQFANAMLNGVSPAGEHYYPAFPYSSYTRMSPKDISDLFAYLKTLPAVVKSNQPNELALPFKLRRGIGLWKSVFLSSSPATKGLPDNEQVKTGQYLAEGPGHCGECHTPRTVFGFGGGDNSRWLSGGPAPEGDGRIPNITSGEGGVASWSPSDLAGYFESGFTPVFDSVGGSMVSVQENLSMLPPEDRAAIAAYLKAVPAINTK